MPNSKSGFISARVGIRKNDQKKIGIMRKRAKFIFENW